MYGLSFFSHIVSQFQKKKNNNNNNNNKIKSGRARVVKT